MALKFNKSLNNKKWTTSSDLPTIQILNDFDYCFKSSSGSIFKKMFPDAETVVFNKNTLSSNVRIDDTYLSVTGEKTFKVTPCGVKSFPFQSTSKALLTLRIKSLNSEFSAVGFCDENRPCDSTEFKNVILWNFNEPFIRYYLNTGELQIVGINLNTCLKENDILNMALDRESNQLWVGVNYIWYPNKPNEISENNLSFSSDILNIETPVLFITPSNNCFEIIKYEKFKPTCFSDAVSLLPYDWYLETQYRDSYMEEKTCL